MGIEWDDAKGIITEQFSSIAPEKLEAMYRAGLNDRAVANDRAAGYQVRIGEALRLDGERQDPTKGKVFIDTTNAIEGTTIRAFSEISKNLGVDIHLVDNLEVADTGRQANGQYINGDIYINVNSDFEKNLGYIFMHEVTHHLKMYAPEQFSELENLVREKWFNYNPEQMQSEIAKKIAAYAKYGQELTDEEALEEIIADASHEFINDRNFASQIAEESPALAKAILNSIKNALRMLRRIFSQGSYNDETHMNSLFSQLDILSEAERLWLGAYTQAVKNKAAVGIQQWQDAVNEESSGNTSFLVDRMIENAKDYSQASLDDVGFDFNSIENTSVTKATKPIVKLASKLGASGRTYSHKSVPIDFYYSNRNVSESLSKQNKTDKRLGLESHFGDFAKMLSCIDDLVNRAVLIEQHDDLKNDTNVKQIYRLASAFRDGEDVVPVKLVIKERYDGTASLYVSMTLEKIKKAESGEQPTENGRDYSPSASERIISEVKHKDKIGKNEKYSLVTPQQDTDYMNAVEFGDMETAQHMVDELAAQAMPNTKTPGRWFHGTENDFTVFDFSQGGKNGTAEGFGIYLAKDRDVSEHYGKRMIEGYVNIEHPATSTERTLTKDDLVKLISATVDQEAERLSEDYDSVEAAKYDTWISNYTYTYEKSLEDSISEVADNILRMTENDMEIVQEVMGGMAIRDYEEASAFYDILTDLTGIDGFTTTWENRALEGTRDIALAFRSEQIKDSSPVTYDDAGNVIPLSERFNMENPDIRYSISDTMSVLEDNFNEYKEDKTNLRIAAEAIADLQELHDSRGGSYLAEGRRNLDDMPIESIQQDRSYDVDRGSSDISATGTYRTLAKGISASLVNEGYVDFIGQKVESPEDLAKLCQVLRDPRFETSRLILTKGNKIVSFQSTSSRLPGISLVHNRESDYAYYMDVAQQVKNLGADGFYMLHNHPSGNVKASEDDLEVTEKHIKAIGADKFKGHVILDHDKFGFIDGSITDSERMIPGQQTIDFIHEPEIDHPLLGKKITSNEELANIARSVNISENCSALVYVGNGGVGVRGLQEISNSMLDDKDAMHEFIRNNAVDFGAGGVFLYTKFDNSNKNRIEVLEALYRDGMLVDVIYNDMSYMAQRKSRYNDPAHLGLNQDELKERTAVFESMSGAESYEGLKSSITPRMDADGNILADGQMEYFKNSQARDAEGRLVPVYHSTHNGGFTIFDPSYSDDNRSLFFTSNLRMSQSYSGGGERINPYDLPNKAITMVASPLVGTYACYLNLENPMIIDCKGRNWDSILADGFDRLYVRTAEDASGMHTRLEIKNASEYAIIQTCIR